MDYPQDLEYADYYEDSLPNYDVDYADGEDSVSYDSDSDSVGRIFHECSLPVIFNAFQQTMWLFLCCITFRIVASFGTNTLFKHLLSALSGSIGLWSIVGLDCYFTILFALFSYSLVIATKNNSLGNNTPHKLGLLLLIYLVLREHLPVSFEEQWDAVRGIQMIMVMKILSVCLDESQNSSKFELTAVSYYGYILCPGTIIFGPWVTYTTYCKTFENQRWTFTRIQRVLAVAICSYVCLAVSVCVVYGLFSFSESRWILMVRSALTVRFSHYFVCYLSETTCLLSGFRMDSHIEVSEIWKIESPRSLVEIVKYWNQPMHRWLKNYVFRPAYRKGSLYAVLLTFLVSSMLHGMNFGLSMVLLSLGLYTYVEYTLRSKLATIFNACVGSRKCVGTCTHTYKGTHFLVALTNVGFSIWVYFHLSYLGVMLDNVRSDDVKQNEESLISIITQDLQKWSNLDFMSHVNMLFVWLGSIAI